MDKTIKINLGGTLFQIDEDAYNMLRKYLQEIDSKLRHTQGGTETIEDIESRIAEIFQSQKGLAGVITKENVEAVISIVGKPEDFDIEEDAGDYKEPSYKSEIPKKLYRNPDDRIISGVCGGIGAYLNMEPVWVRILFIIFACFFGIGFFVYVALWIALPLAHSDAQKREMYGTADFKSALRRQKNYTAVSSGHSGVPAGSTAGNAINEVFRAIGRVFYIILRVFLIIIGVTFVITGFITLVSFVMVFFFNYPGYFSIHSHDVNLFYLPDFLNYVVNPALVPWILVLGFIVILMPLLALIYWGVKMIFWFRAKDGIVALAGLVLWVISVAALSIILFNEGISFAESARTYSNEIIEKPPRELYIQAGKKVSGLNYDKEINLPEKEYNIYLVEESRALYISTCLTMNNSDDKSLRINVRKRSAGRSRTDATRRAVELVYGYNISGDTIAVDEYFTVPAGNKWSFDNVGVNLYIPEGTIIHFDQSTIDMFSHCFDHSDRDYFGYDEDYFNPEQTWEMTRHGLNRISGENKK